MPMRWFAYSMVNFMREDTGCKLSFVTNNFSVMLIRFLSSCFRLQRCEHHINRRLSTEVDNVAALLDMSASDNDSIAAIGCPLYIDLSSNFTVRFH